MPSLEIEVLDAGPPQRVKFTLGAIVAYGQVDGQCVHGKPKQYQFDSDTNPVVMTTIERAILEDSDPC